jgi:hypothetical protein
MPALHLSVYNLRERQKSLLGRQMNTGCSENIGEKIHVGNLVLANAAMAAAATAATLIAATTTSSTTTANAGAVKFAATISVYLVRNGLKMCDRPSETREQALIGIRTRFVISQPGK